MPSIRPSNWQTVEETHRQVRWVNMRMLSAVYRRHIIFLSWLGKMSVHLYFYTFLLNNINNKRCHCLVTDRLHRLFCFLACTVPLKKKKKKTTVIGQVSTIVSATVAQLREMNASMQAQEDAWLQRLMGPWEGNAEQSNESAGSHAWTDQPRKPRETPWTHGQDTL